MSLSRERRLGIDVSSTLSVQDQSETAEDDGDNSDFTKKRSLFSKNMPGVMTAEEVESQIDLGQMRIKLGSKVVHLEVSFPSTSLAGFLPVANGLLRSLLAGIPEIFWIPSPSSAYLASFQQRWVQRLRSG